MATMRNRFEEENPHLKPVEASEKKEVLQWAHDSGYILLTKFRKILYYSEKDLEMALMWASKYDE